MRKQWLAAFFAVSMLAGCAGNSESNANGSSKGKINISIVQYSQHSALDSAREGFINALNENSYDESKVVLDSYNAQNDPSNVETIATTVVNNNPTLIFGIATPVAQGIAQKTSDIPLVVTAVTDPAASGLVESNELPNCNVTGTSDMVNADVMVNLLLEVVPNAKKVGIMYCSSEDNSKIQAKALEGLLSQKGISVKHFTASDSSLVQATADSAKGVVDAMLIPTDNLMAECMPMIAESLNASQIPSIVGEEALVANGGTASRGIDYHHLGFQAGLMAIDILEGKDPASMPVYFVPENELTTTLNTTSISAVGISVDQALLDSSTLFE